MKMTTLFYVDICDRHIESGQPREIQYCPIALAVKEALATARRIAVDAECLEFETRPYSLCLFRLSNEATNFITRFDSGLPVEPFTLLLEEVP